ncbi:MAG: hypothetical protein ACRDNE_00585 [Gaiellaceae bacterium]
MTTAAALRAWLRTFRNRDEAVETLVRLIGASQAQMTSLVDAYMATKSGRSVKGLATPTLRALEEVYERPFGALGGLDAGADFGAAITSAQASVGKLAATDLQLAQTHAAREWMSDEDRIAGYERVISSGRPCGLCVAASTQLYAREDLMPIHEGCSCTVSPLTSTGPAPRPINPDRWQVVKAQVQSDLSARSLSRLHIDAESLPNVTRVVPDLELGLRLVDETWAAAA